MANNFKLNTMALFGRHDNDFPELMQWALEHHLRTNGYAIDLIEPPMALETNPPQYMPIQVTIHDDDLAIEFKLRWGQYLMP